MTALLADLRRHRLVREIEPVRRSERGRPTQLFVLDDGPWCVAGAQLEGDEVTVVATTLAGQVLWTATRRRGGGAGGWARPIREALRAGTGCLAGRRLVAVAAELPTRRSPSDRVAAAQDLRRVLHGAGLVTQPCLVEVHDATRLAGLWATHLLRLDPVAVALYVGGVADLAAGLIVGGRTFSGATGSAGTVTHTASPVGDIPDCACPRSSCLNSVASPAALLDRAGVLSSVATRSLVAEDPVAAIALLRNRAERGDAQVLAALRLTGEAVGEVVDTAIGLLDPTAIIFGGYLGALYPYLATAVASRVRSSERIRVVSDLGASGAARGAALTARVAVLESPLTFTRPVLADDNQGQA